MNTIIQKATETDFPAIRALYDEARAYFRESGIDQWQTGYPEDDVILNDITKGEAYVCTLDGAIVAVFVVTSDRDASYDTLSDGTWQSDDDYVAIHRVAVSNACKGHGIGSLMIRFAEDGLLGGSVRYIRGDTHADNRSMQRLLSKNGFRRAGIITLVDGSDKGAKRIAFDKIINF